MRRVIGIKTMGMFLTMIVCISFLAGVTSAGTGGSLTKHDVVLLETPEDVDVSYIGFHPTNSSICLMVGGNQYTNADYKEWSNPNDDTYSYDFTNEIYTYDGIGAPSKIIGGADSEFTSMDWHPSGEKVLITGSKVTYRTEVFPHKIYPEYVDDDRMHFNSFEGALFEYVSGWPQKVITNNNGLFSNVCWNHGGNQAIILGSSLETYTVPSEWTYYENKHEHYGSGSIWTYSGSSITEVTSMVEDFYPLATAWAPDDSYAVIVGYEFDWDLYYKNKWDDDNDNDDDYQSWEKRGAILKYQNGLVSIQYQNQYSCLTGISWQPGGDFALITGYTTTFMEREYSYESTWGQRYRYTSWLEYTSQVLKYDQSGLTRLSCPDQKTPLTTIEWRGSHSAIISGNRYYEYIWVYSYDWDRDGYVNEDENDDYMKAVDNRVVYTPLIEYSEDGNRFECSHYRFNDKSIYDIAYSPDGTYALLLGGDDTLVKYSPKLEPPVMKDDLGDTATIPILVFDQHRPQDGAAMLDISQYFDDENDADHLVYTIEYQESPGILEAVINGTYLDIIQHNPTWSGSLLFSIRATDNTSAYTVSNTFLVTVNPLPTVTVGDSFSFSEDNVTQGVDLIDLEKYFSVCDNESMVYSIEYQENPGLLEATLSGHKLSFSQKQVNWYGSLNFSVRASYPNGAYTDSNDFKVTVVPSNDPPNDPMIFGPDKVASNAYFSPQWNGDRWETTVDFHGLSSDIDNDGRNIDPLTYIWDFGDGEQGNGQSVSHTYKKTGNYTVTLTVIDSKGSQKVVTHEIEVSLAGDTWYYPLVYTVTAIIIIIIALIIIVIVVRRRKKKKKEAASKARPERVAPPRHAPPPPPSPQQYRGTQQRGQYGIQQPRADHQAPHRQDFSTPPLASPYESYSQVRQETGYRSTYDDYGSTSGYSQTAPVEYRPRVPVRQPPSPPPPPEEEMQYF